MNNINTYIIKKFDIDNLNVKLPSFYKASKNETKLAYLLLNYLYYEKFKKILNINLIAKDDNNKPIFLNNNIFFNISHSKNYVCCSLANINIGIDLEEDRDIKENVLNKIINEKDKNIAPIKIWNIKEAYSKYLGIGLKLDFSKISVKEIKKNTILNTFFHNINNTNIYFSICCDKNKYISNNINFIDENTITNFYYKKYIKF